MLSVPPEFGIDAGAIQSGAQALVGYDVDLTAEDGSTLVTLEIAAKHLNRNGTLHGGIITMLLDAAAGFAASRAASPTRFVQVVTVTLNTQYLAPARSGLVTATGRYAGGGVSLSYAGAELRSANGRVLASATGVFKRLKERGT